MNHKIAIINPLGAHGSSFHFYLFGQAIGLINNGCDVYLYTNNKTNNPRIKGLSFFQFYKNIFSSRWRWISGLRYFFGSTLSIFSARIRGCKVFHYHIFYTNILVFFDLALTKLLFGKTVITIHDVSSFMDGFDSPLLTRWIYKMTDSITTHNEFSKQELQKKENLANEQISIIPHGNYLPFIEVYKDELEARKHLNIPENKTVLLFFGLIKKEKGLEVLLKAIHELKSKYADILLVIAGRPWNNTFSEYQDIIDRYNLSENCILHTKFIPDEDVKYYYAASDLVVLPYIKIYQSGVLLMSLSYKKISIVSDLPPMTDIITDNNTGFVFKNGDSFSLAKKIEDILSDKYDLIRISNNAQKIVTNKYDWNNIGSQMKIVYDSLI